MRETTSTIHKTETYHLLLPQERTRMPRSFTKKKRPSFPLSTLPISKSLTQAIIALLRKQKVQEEEHVSLENSERNYTQSVNHDTYSLSQKSLRDLSIFWDHLVNVLAISNERGSTQTSYTTKSGVTITLVEYQTAPKIFNVRIQAPQEMTELLQKNKSWILNKLRSRKKSFSVHQFDIENYPLDKNNEIEKGEVLSIGNEWL